MTVPREFFVHVANVIDVSVPLPAELITGLFIRRADSEQISRIRKVLNSLHPFRSSQAYESIWTPAKGTSWSGMVSPREADWRYWILATTSAQPLHELVSDAQLASRLTEIELSCPLLFGNDGGLGMSFQYGYDMFAMAHEVPPVPVLDATFVNLVQEIDERIKVVAKPGSNLAFSLEAFRQITYMPRQTPLTVLGLFTVLESVLTHNPEGRVDGLGHQISTKIPLLSRRMATPLNYDDFTPMPETTVWKKLYECRNAIAHGGKPDYSGKLKGLKSMNTVATFLRSATKAVLRQALHEPDLCNDLRAC